jgi:AraC-like DNA-binding protein
MIQCSDKSVTEISAELGFSSSQYFSTAFKRYHLFSPMAWKKMHDSDPSRLEGTADELPDAAPNALDAQR